MLTVVSVAALVAGCRDDETAPVSRDAQVYVATVRDVVDDQPAPEDPDVLPVVYVAPAARGEIPADVQAEVAEELHDEVDLRFADERDEAVLTEEDGLPVRAEGLLLVVGELPEAGDPIEMRIEIYRSERNWSVVDLTLANGSSGWSVTGSTVVPDGG